jgi:tetratricopeptide (TPR) repeat protein
LKEKSQYSGAGAMVRGLGIGLALCAAGGCVFLLQTKIDKEKRPGEAIVEELMYFPSGQFMEAVTVGYDNLAADLVWLRAMQYYGEHRLSDLKYQYLDHIFDVLTSLDPRFVDAYTFGSLLLADDAKEPDNAMRLLDKGMRNNPDDWRIPFTKGFICYVFLRDYQKAGRFFQLSSRMEGAPEMAARFASFAFQKGGDRITAVNLWTELYARSNNEVEKVTALRYIKELVSSILDDKVNEFAAKHGRYPHGLAELVDAGLISKLPVAPDGDTFVLNWKNRRVQPASGPIRKGD